MIRRYWVVAGAGVIAATMACGSDQPTSVLPKTLSPAALALHFDSLAGALQASSPGDPRLIWYQDIARVVALGVAPTVISLRLGGPAILETVTEIDAFPDSLNGKQVADSTYRLRGWTPQLRPTAFVDVRVRFLQAGTGKPDTTATYITIYPDSTGKPVVDSTETTTLNVLSNRGICEVTALQHLTVPPNPCTKVAVDWVIVGAPDLLVISPQAQVSGTHLTQ